MKVKITETYLNEALRLRKEYVNFMNILNNKSPLLSKYRNEFEEIKSRVQSVDINDSNIKIEETIFKELEFVDEKLVLIQKELEPIYDGISELQSESDKLYDAVTQKYPKMSPEEIKDQIWEKVKHILV